MLTSGQGVHLLPDLTTTLPTSPHSFPVLHITKISTISGTEQHTFPVSLSLHSTSCWCRGRTLWPIHPKKPTLYGPWQELVSAAQFTMQTGLSLWSKKKKMMKKKTARVHQNPYSSSILIWSAPQIPDPKSLWILWQHWAVVSYWSFCVCAIILILSQSLWASAEVCVCAANFLWFLSEGHLWWLSSA